MLYNINEVMGQSLALLKIGQLFIFK